MTRAPSDHAADIASQILDAPPSERPALLASVAVMVLLSLSPEAAAQFGAEADLSVSIRRALMRRHAKRAA